MILTKKYNLPFYINSIIISIIVAIPLFTVFFGFFENTTEYFSILRNTFLNEYITNSLFILICVVLLTFFFGFTSAYLVSFYSFPLSNFFKWSLILSFAVPAYIFAYSITAFFESYGTAYSILFKIFGENEYHKFIPKFDGLFGSIISLSFSLFGYVYVLTRATFFYQTQNLFDVGKNLGFSKEKTFTKIILPSVRPSIIAGLSLVAMETLSDFGAVSFFGVSTLTTGIYNAWISFDDLALANRLAFILIVFIFLLFILESLSRKKAKYHNSSSNALKRMKVLKLKGIKSTLAFLFCFTLFFLSFLFPVLQMLYWTFKFPSYINDINFISLSLNTLSLVIISSFILLFFSFLNNFSNRITNSKFLDILNTFSISGYAMPGIILALAFMSFFSWFSNFTGYNLKSLMIGSIGGLVLAYFVRFYSLSFNSIKSNYLKINKSIDESAYLLGYSKFKIFYNIHLPFLKKSCLLITVLVTIEIIKELPITLILRPFNFETFATKAYSFASQDLLEAAAFPSLCLISWSSIFILVSSKYFLSRERSLI